MELVKLFQEILSTEEDKKMLRQAEQARNHTSNLLKNLIAHRNIPNHGLSDLQIHQILNELALLDKNVGMGEREGRVACDMIRNRHFGFAHGIGRSGNLTEMQPKAVGSSILYKLANSLVLDYIHQCGIKTAKEALLVPMATGMSISLVLNYLKKQFPTKKYVLWPRMDQKSAFKAIILSDLVPVIIPNQIEGDSIRTDLIAVKTKIDEIGPENILCILSTSSCFAPRVCDRLKEISSICKEHEFHHVINNAYGLQSPKATHKITEAASTYSKLIVIQSTDKNLLVPVGGSIILTFERKECEKIADCYAGRASISPILDVFITMLSLGSDKFSLLRKERLENFHYAREKLVSLSQTHKSIKILDTPQNDISIGIAILTQKSKSIPESNQTYQESTLKSNSKIHLGSALFYRLISGSRLITNSKSEKSISSFKFVNFGAHVDEYPFDYLTIAIALGIKREEIDEFLVKFEKLLIEEINGQS